MTAAVNILALDTSTEYCFLALRLDGKTLVRDVLAGQRHSELLLPLLDEMLTEAGIRLADFDGIAFGNGPGSFTGLRIACGVAQGLALGAGLPVAGVSTLLALAEGCGGDRAVACLDARMGEVYHAAYEKRGGEWQTVSDPGLYAPGDVPSLDGGDWIACGSGFAQHGEELLARYAGQVARVDAALLPRAGFIARLAAPVFAAGLGVDAAEALPLYIRDKVALKTSERL